MDATPKDIEALVREKYAGNQGAEGVAEDLARLSAGEPLAYVIGNIPFLGVTVHLDSHPLIPRPETEYWTELLIAHINNKSKNTIIYDSVSILDLCAGSGAIGLAVLKHCPNARVTFSELALEHAVTIQKNIALNNLDASRADIRTGNLFTPLSSSLKRDIEFGGLRPGQAANASQDGINEARVSAMPEWESMRSGPPNPITSGCFDFIATNPPYIPDTRTLDESVTKFEPSDALFSGADGLDIIRRIIEDAKDHLTPTGELWMECDVANIETAKELLLAQGYGEAKICNDQYGRERVIVAHL